MLTWRLPFLLAAVLLTGCALTRADDLSLSPTAAPSPAMQITPVPTHHREPQPIPTDAPTALASQDRCSDSSAETGAHHTINAQLDYPNRALRVEQQIHYVNHSPGALERIILNVHPANRANAFTLDSIHLNGNTVPYGLAGSRLTVTLPQPLEPSCDLTLRLSFSLRIPPIDATLADAYRGYFGYSPRQINLGGWLPTLAQRHNDEWITHEPVPIGEQDVLDVANWDVTLTVSGAPDTLRAAAPGIIRENQPGRWRFELTGARDFSLSLSDQFNVASQRAESGTKIEIYTFADAIGIADGPAYALGVVARSLSMFNDLYGPYPYERLVVVQADFPDGMEFSGIVFVGSEYFRWYSGDPAAYLTIITAHEVSHQWWYASIGSDQALYPWLDEALATYSEYVFIEEYYPQLRDWWWEFRVDRLSPEGFVDSSVYEFSSRRAYINAVYLRGARMLHDLRADLGTDVFFDWLRRYALAGAGRVMTPDHFWSLLTPQNLEATANTRARYLRQPQIITIAP